MAKGGAAQRHPFPKRYRLTKTDEFSSVFGFKKALRAKYFLLHHLPKDNGPARLGLVIGKRYAPLSVKRNLIRRLAREAFRLMHHRLPPGDLILRLGTKLQPFPERQVLAAEIRYLLAKYASKNSPASSTPATTSTPHDGS